MRRPYFRLFKINDLTNRKRQNFTFHDTYRIGMVASRISTNLQACLQGEQPVPTEDEPDLKVVQNAELEQKAPCGKALLVDETDAVKLQKLLAMAGADPGPADGIIGPLTREALFELTGETFDDRKLPDVIEALDSLACSQVE